MNFNTSLLHLCYRRCYFSVICGLLRSFGFFISSCIYG
nr:MAG TPA: Ndr family protein [Caudoviricetes sp.]